MCIKLFANVDKRRLMCVLEILKRNITNDKYTIVQAGNSTSTYAHDKHTHALITRRHSRALRNTLTRCHSHDIGTVKDRKLHEDTSQQKTTVFFVSMLGRLVYG